MTEHTVCGLRSSANADDGVDTNQRRATRVEIRTKIRTVLRLLVVTMPFFLSAWPFLLEHLPLWKILDYNHLFSFWILPFLCTFTVCMCCSAPLFMSEREVPASKIRVALQQSVGLGLYIGAGLICRVFEMFVPIFH